ncbi:hypothetical protein CBER1_09403 [Cercospora berteroae]|uniref:Uncharacterized protein n=1 Tax=Cercospora berteroae TaxID=357750 RepID=A0A2S6CE50_9PEZI|nr:hypothetical protein CBER1_09403 [Cercospora berteroae]
MSAPDRTSYSLRLHSARLPGLQQGETYLVSASQDISYVDANGTAQTPRDAALSATQQAFKVEGSRYALDKSTLHSVYPPEGHADAWNILPHIVFKSPALPWSHRVTGEEDATQPYVGLLLFTEDELRADAVFLAALDSIVGASTFGHAHRLGATFSVPLTEPQVEAYVDTSIGARSGGSRTETLFLPPNLYHAVFAKAKQFQPLAHVRTVDTTHHAGAPGDQMRAFSVCVSARTGPSAIRAPTKVYAHLCVLPQPYRPTQRGERCAVVSLHSWSYVCQPHAYKSLLDDFDQLGRSVGPLRAPIGNDAVQQAAWGRARLAMGYTMAHYVPQSGEHTVCMYRGMLSPYPKFPPDLPPSDTGAELDIVDKTVGVVDTTYRIAWETGRLMMLSNKQVSAALVRLRGSAHELCAAATKTAENRALSVHETAVKLPTMVQNLHATAVNVGEAAFGSRWVKKPGVSMRPLFSLNNASLQAKYLANIGHVTARFAMAEHDELEQPKTTVRTAAFALAADAQTGRFDGSNRPVSTDYASLLQWILDRWQLKSIPWHSLVADPTHLPPESIRSFYVDHVWFRAFADGALSVGEHYTDDDDVRECLKHCMDQILGQDASNNMAKQIPEWGMLIRSEIVSKFHNLKIVAPRIAGQPQADDVLRSEVVDGGSTLLLLFDRCPAAGQFPDGITLLVPEHQMRFAVGDSETWTFNARTGGAERLKFNWHLVTIADQSPTQVPAPRLYSIVDGSDSAFDFEWSLLRPQKLVRDLTLALGREQLAKNPSSVLATQLMTRSPELRLADSARDQELKVVGRRLLSKARRADSGVKHPLPMKTEPLGLELPPIKDPLPVPESVSHDQLPAWVQGALARYYKVSLDVDGFWLRKLHPLAEDPPASSPAGFAIDVYNRETKLDWRHQDKWQAFSGLPAQEPKNFGRVLLACKFGKRVYPSNVRFRINPSGVPLELIGSGRTSITLTLHIGGGNDSGPNAFCALGSPEVSLPRCILVGSSRAFWSTTVRRDREQIAGTSAYSNVLRIRLQSRNNQELRPDQRWLIQPIEFRLENVCLAWANPQDGTGAHHSALGITIASNAQSDARNAPPNVTEYQTSIKTYAMDLEVEPPQRDVPDLIGRTT